MVGTANDTFNIPRCVNKFHPPVTADIIKDSYGAVPVAGYQKGYACEIYRRNISRVTDIVAETKAEPVRKEDFINFIFKMIRISVTFVGQSTGLADR